MAEDCVFCKIAAGEIPVKAVYEDDEIIAFPDINPQAPVHLLVIPRKHYADVTEATGADSGLIGRLFTTLTRVASEQDLVPEGFRIVVNTGPKGGQTVRHLHFHLLGGRFMGWPPG
jgi:histidine triad (HIT) family protein